MKFKIITKITIFRYYYILHHTHSSKKLLELECKISQGNVMAFNHFLSRAN